MKKLKVLVSVMLSAIMVLSAVMFGIVAQATILPIDEVEAYLVLKNYTDDQIKSMPLSTILELLKDKDGNSIEIASSAKVVWAYFKDDTGNLIHDEYHIVENNETVDLSYFKETTGYTMEMIIGSGKQLDSANKRYIVRVYFQGYDETISVNLYSQNGEEKTEIIPIKKIITTSQYEHIQDINGNPIPMLNFMYVVELGMYQDLFINLNSEMTKRPDVKVEAYELSDMELSTPITEKILNQGMSTAYKLNSSNLTDGNIGFILVYWIDGMPQDLTVVTFSMTASVFHVTGSLSSADGTNANVVNTVSEDIDLDNDIYHWNFELKQGFPVDGSYTLNLQITNYFEDMSDKVVKAVEGEYSTLEQASGKEDIKDRLFSDEGYMTVFGTNGKSFTIFLENGVIEDTNVYHIDVKTSEYNNVMPAFDEAPIVGAKDPYFRVDGAKYGDKTLDTYIVENGKAINMDTLYGYGYQTIFINDKEVDLSQLKPTFWFGDADRVETYAVSKTEGTKQTSSVSVRDFSKGMLQYGTIIDTHEKNYQVQFVKKETGSKLFVNGPSERSVFLDQYFEYKHDILIANVGDQPLTGLEVELDATHVKLDDYWTVGGTGNDTLAAFTTTSTDTQYGELANIAKIRLLPDGEGEIEGTLIITAVGQEPVVINLSGRAKNPTIVTEELDEAVKYVPYSYLVATDNMNDWNGVTFSIESGELPKGIKLFPTTGEIYGVPQEMGEFNIRVKAAYDYFDSSFADLTLVVKDNTNAYVLNATDENYDILNFIGEKSGDGDNADFVLSAEDANKDQVFRSEGAFKEYKAFWLDGKKLEKGKDYKADEGSTKITIFGQTLNDLPDDSHTIAIEFRVDGDDTKALKRTSQNFIKKSSGTTDGNTSDDTSVPDDTSKPDNTNTPTPTENDVIFKPVPVEGDMSDIINGITIFAPTGVMPNDAVLVIKPDGSIPTNKGSALDITFTLNGEKVQPNGSMTVRVPIPDSLKNVIPLYVYHITNGKYDLVDSWIDGDFVCFRANSFSTYVISGKKLDSNGNEITYNNLGTSENPVTGIGISAAGLVLSGAVLTAVLTVKKKKH